MHRHCGERHGRKFGRCGEKHERHEHVEGGHEAQERHGGQRHGWGGPGFGHGDHGFGWEGPFGVRRPLRFLAHKLSLNERQIGEFVRILDALKIERAQHEVDRRRVTATLADVLAGESLDELRLVQVGDERVKMAERLRDAVVSAVRTMHAELTPEQRATFVHLVRLGVFPM